MPVRRLFTQDLAQGIISTLLPLRDSSVGGDGSVPGLRNVQQADFQAFRAPENLGDLLDVVMVIPFLTTSSLGPAIQNTNSQYLFRLIYIRATASDEFANVVTIGRTETMVEALMNHPTLEIVSTPGLQIIRMWPERIEWEPEEDHMLDGKLDLQTDIVSWNMVIDTKAGRF